VGKWGKNLAVRIPLEIAKATQLSDGKQVEIETRDGDIVIRRPVDRARADAQLAAEEILSERKRHSLGKISIRALVEEGRRG
jgi:antitoxin component of MazEF toxin-antitoxin module